MAEVSTSSISSGAEWERSGGGILVPFVAEAFASAIIELLDNPEEAAEMGQESRDWVLKNRSYELLAQRVEKRGLDAIGVEYP